MPIEVLREIRSAVDQMSAKLVERIDNVAARIDNVEKSLGARVDNVEKSLGARLDNLDRRVTQGFLDTKTKIADLAGEVHEHGDRLENILTGQFGQDVRDLKARVLALEQQRAPQAHEAQAPYGEKPK